MGIKTPEPVARLCVICAYALCFVVVVVGGDACACLSHNGGLIWVWWVCFWIIVGAAENCED